LCPTPEELADEEDDELDDDAFAAAHSEMRSPNIRLTRPKSSGTEKSKNEPPMISSLVKPVTLHSISEASKIVPSSLAKTCGNAAVLKISSWLIPCCAANDAEDDEAVVAAVGEADTELEEEEDEDGAAAVAVTDCRPSRARAPLDGAAVGGADAAAVWPASSCCWRYSTAAESMPAGQWRKFEEEIIVT
jgi:hypothetical protein